MLEPFADLDQMPRGQYSNGLVIYADEVAGETGQPAIDQHIRYFLVLNSEQQIDRSTARGDDQGVEAACQQLINFLLLKLGIFIGRSHNQVIATLPQDLGESLGNFSEERVEEVRNHQSNQI